MDREFSQPASIDLTTCNLKTLANDEWNAIGGRISRNGDFFAHFRNVDGISELHIIDLNNNSDSRVDGLPKGALEAPLIAGYDLMDWDPDSKRLVFSLQSPKHNLNLWLYDNDEKEVRQLTFVPMAGIPKEAFVEPRHEKYSTFDGLKIPVLVYQPQDRRGPLETVVYVHGGPESQEKARFNIIIQYLTNHGFLVLAPNVRGSSGYGRNGFILTMSRNASTPSRTWSTL